MASDRSRPDRVIGAVDSFELNGPDTDQICQLPHQLSIASIKQLEEPMAWDKSEADSATRSGHERSHTTRCDRWVKAANLTVAPSWLVHQSTPTRQVARGLDRGRVRGDESNHGLSVLRAPGCLDELQGQTASTAILSGTRTPPGSKHRRDYSPRFRPRARPLGTRPPRSRSTP